MRYIILLSLLISAFVLKAENVQMADTMRSEGKIYVVVAVLCVILIGLISYLISLDRKLGKLEKQVNQ